MSFAFASLSTETCTRSGHILITVSVSLISNFSPWARDSLIQSASVAQIFSNTALPLSPGAPDIFTTIGVEKNGVRVVYNGPEDVKCGLFCWAWCNKSLVGA